MNSSIAVSHIVTPSTSSDLGKKHDDKTFWRALSNVTNSNVVLAALYIILGILLLISIYAYFLRRTVRRRRRRTCCGTGCIVYPNDDTKPFALVKIGAYFLDWVTDIAWAVEVCATLGMANIWSILSFIAFLVPYILNIVCAAIFLGHLKKNENNDIRSDSWLTLHASKVLFTVAMTGNGEPVLQLFNSEIFGWEIFSMKLRYKTLEYSSKWTAVILNCILEKLPQFTLQILYFSVHSEDYGDYTIIAILFSAINLLWTFLTFCRLLFINKSRHFKQERIIVSFEFEQNKTIESLSSSSKYHCITKTVFGRKNMITRMFIAKNLGFASSGLVCQYVEFRYDKNCVLMVLEILSSSSDQHRLKDTYLNNKLDECKILLNEINAMLNAAYKCYFPIGHHQTTDQEIIANTNPIHVQNITAFMYNNEDHFSKSRMLSIGSLQTNYSEQSDKNKVDSNDQEEEEIMVFAV